jgi:hypothetical protein
VFIVTLFALQVPIIDAAPKNGNSHKQGRRKKKALCDEKRIV